VRKTAVAGARHSVDRFLGGLVTLLQPLEGHRVGLDAALLQAMVPADASGQAYDFGSGVGTVAFAAAARASGLRVTGIERERALVELGREALRLPENGAFAPRVTLLVGQIESMPELPDASADWVLMNPPFDDPVRMQPSPDEARRKAHVPHEGLLEAWLQTAMRLIKPGGCVGIIHRPEQLPRIATALTGKFGDIRILPAHPAHDRPALRLLIRAERGSRAPLTIMPGLVLHQQGGAWTAEADAILRGKTELPM
jgi:tRNA1(Val) A37 N6-methylase TrmN6